MPHATVTIDQGTAEALSFPKPQYMAVELERRWLCQRIPHESVVDISEIVDIYIGESQVRLREETFRSGAPAMRRLTRKVGVNATMRLMTSIYLPEHEYAVLARALTGQTLRKRRHRLPQEAGVSLLIDEFAGPLAGLLIAEAEFDSRGTLERYVPPGYFGREVTSDDRYSGGNLAWLGKPTPDRVDAHDA
jgi:CYTH domain-containing protein